MKYMFISNSGQTPRNSDFRYILVFQKICSLVKLIFREAELPQRLKYYMFQEKLFRTSASGTNLVKFVPLENGNILHEFLVFLPKPDRFSSFVAFSKNLKLKETFLSLKNYLRIFSLVSTISVHHK